MLANRGALASRAGLDPDDVVWAEQVHGSGAATVGAAQRGRGAVRPADAIRGVDALVTHERNVGLAVKAADCVPLVLVDPGRGVAAVHAGRAGLEADVVPTAVGALATDPRQVVALVGPAIGGCCYEVTEDVRASLARRVPSSAATTTWGTPALDLPAAVAAQLRSLGTARVAAVGGCTRCSNGWFSHRGARPTDLDTPAGRQAVLVVRHAGHTSQAPTSASLCCPL